MLFQKYKRICNEHYVQKLRALDHHCIIHGATHCGKKTLIDSAFDSVFVIECFSTARETVYRLSNSIKSGNVILLPRIDQKTAIIRKSVCSLIDQFGSHVKFMVTSTSNTMCNELSSRCGSVHIRRLDRAGKHDVVAYIARAENIDLSHIDIDSLGSTVHDVLIEIELRLRGCHIRNDWRLYA